MSQPVTITLRVDGAAQVQAALAKVAGSLRSLVAPVAAAVSAGALASGFLRAAKAGLQFNATLETARLGIAAVQKTFQPQRFKDFNDALRVSAQAVELLKQKAKESPATFEELVRGFQAVTGSATSAGISLRKQVDLVVLMSQALSGLGIANEQLLQETRALIEGHIDRNALAARILQINAQEIAQAREQGRLYEFLTERLKAFKEAGLVGMTTWRTLASNIRDVAQQALGVAFEPVFEKIKVAMQAIVKAKLWEDFAKLIAAAFDLGFKKWTDGTFEELIHLTIRAGFELGMEAIRTSATKMWSFVTEGGLQSIVEFFGRIQATIDTLAQAAVKNIVFGMVAGILYLGDRFRYIAQTFGNLLKGVFKAAIVYFAEGLLKVFDFMGAMTTPARMALARWQAEGTGATEPVAARTWDESLTESLEILQQFEKFFDRNKSIANLVFGGEEPSDTPLTAVEQLKKLLEDARKTREATLPLIGKELDATTEVVKKQSAKKGLLEDEREIRERMAAIELRRAKVEGDFRLTEVEKHRELSRLLNEESRVLAEIVKSLEARAALAKDDQEREQILSRLDTYRGQLAAVQGRQFGMGPDPGSYADQWGVVFKEIREMATITAMDVANVWKAGIGGAVEGISRSMTGLIMATMTWREALMNIYNTIATSLVEAISRMFAEWIVGRLAVKAVEVTSSTAEATAKAPGALFTSISSYGAAAAIGIVALLAALAALSGSFASGGYTGSTSPGVPTGVVHGGEFVFDAEATRYWTPEYLESMRAGNAPPGPGGGGVNVAVFDSRHGADQWLSSGSGRGIVLDIIRQTRHEFVG